MFKVYLHRCLIHNISSFSWFLGLLIVDIIHTLKCKKNGCLINPATLKQENYQGMQLIFT